MMATEARAFRGLLVWRQAMQLAQQCYLLTRTFPPEERYGLSTQIRRAAVSIAANIAEGNGRKTKRDYASFLHVSQGSLRELETYLLLILDVGLSRSDQVEPILTLLESVARLLNRLIESLESNPTLRRDRP